MAREIERKFRVATDAWRDAVSRIRQIEQAYLADTGKAVIRVRIEDETPGASGAASATGAAAILTIKSRGTDLSRDEFEYPIPLEDARSLMQCRQGAILRKTRYDVRYSGFVWEIDVYSGENDGLVIAEVELGSETDAPPLPAFIGAELTGESRYYASELAKRPFCAWSSEERA